MSPHVPLVDWSTTAVNLAEHADNAIHTDAGARAAGFAGALVAGVTTYAYLTHAPATAWGREWLTGGGAHVRFRRPVLDGETVDCTVEGAAEGRLGGGVDGSADDGATVVACVAGDARADAEFVCHAHDLERRDGPGLDPVEFVLDGSWSDYGRRAGDRCAIYEADRIAHPTSWPRIANRFCHEQLVSGPWVHTRSRIVHSGTAAVGSTIRAEATIAERFDTRAGVRVVLDVRIAADGSPVATVEHEAIVELATS